MTQEEKQIKLAEAAGWTEISDWKAAGINGKHPTESWVEVIPDYFSDLNAVHELENVLSPLQEVTYWENLLQAHEYMDSRAGCATAAQRAEAIGLTLNLWKQ